MNSERGEIMIQEINVQIDKQAMQKHIEKQLDECIQKELWFVDVKRISELTCMPVRSLEEDILSHPYMKAIEIKKARKRYYEARKAFETIKEIMNSW